MRKIRMSKCPRKFVGKKVSGNKNRLNFRYKSLMQMSDHIIIECIRICIIALNGEDKKERDYAEDIAMGAAVMKSFLNNVSARRNGIKASIDGEDLWGSAEKLRREIFTIAKEMCCIQLYQHKHKDTPTAFDQEASKI